MKKTKFNNHPKAPYPPKCPHGIDIRLPCVKCAQIQTNTMLAICYVAPNGTIKFMPADKNKLETAARKWEQSLTTEQKAAHRENMTMGGAVQIRMLKTDFDNLPEELRYANPVEAS